MRRLPADLRVSFCLVCLTLSILFLASAFGLVPDSHQAILQGRKALCEEMALHCSYSAQRGDFEAFQATAQAVVERNADILSAGVRRADGKLSFHVRDHESLWNDAEAGTTPETHLRVPIVMDDKLWGSVELCFRPVTTGFLSTAFRNPIYRLMAFVALPGGLLYYWFLRRLLQGMNGGQERAVPKRVRTALNTLAEGVVILDKDQRIVMANQAFADLVKRDAGELQGQKVSDLAWQANRENGDAEDANGLPRAEYEYPWEKTLNQGTSQVGHLLKLDLDDRCRWTLAVNSSPIVAEDGSHRGVMATFDNLTAVEKKNSHLRKLLHRLKQSREEIRTQNHQLKLLAIRDPLTACFNRRYFFEQLETHWNSAQRYSTPFSCVLLDIDHFKSVNDTHGHSTGDQVLRQVAEILRGLVRTSDIVCRYGGEEFCILLPTTQLADGLLAAERYREAIAAQPCGEVRVTISLGVSASTQGAREPRELIDQADKALYAAKNGGRNRTVSWEDIAHLPEMPKKKKRETDTVHDLGVPIPFHAVTALVAALGHRHADTAEHSRRVADLCVAVANGLLSQSQCYILEVAGLLHDIGKLGVPDAVLLKPGPLTKEEWQVIRTHEHIGDEIILSAFSSPELHDIIRNHHAWYGGTPFDPNLAKGTDIPLGARILTIADSYDAIVSDRVYRKGRTREEAFAELRRCAGVQFDPELVERFVEVIMDRDEGRESPAMAVSKPAALKIGMQIEKLAIALDAGDTSSIHAMAAFLRTTASAHGIDTIAHVSGRLEATTAANPTDPISVTELTLELLDLCRATYNSYLPQPEVEPAKPERIDVPLAG